MTIGHSVVNRCAVIRAVGRHRRDLSLDLIQQLRAEGLVGSVIGLLGLALRVPDHSTLSRRAATLEVPRPTRSSASRTRSR